MVCTNIENYDYVQTYQRTQRSANGNLIYNLNIVDSLLLY